MKIRKVEKIITALKAMPVLSMMSIELNRLRFMFQFSTVITSDTSRPTSMTGSSQVFFFRIPRKRTSTPSTDNDIILFICRIVMT